MLEHLILQLLLYMDFGGKPQYEKLGNNCLVFNSNTALKPCNRVCNLQSITDIDIAQLKEYFGTMPFTWVVSSQDNNTHEALKKNDFIYKGDFLAMILENTNMQPINSNPLSTTITNINDNDNFERWLELVATSYTYDKQQLRNAIINLKKVGKEDVILYSGLKNNILVSACMVIQHEDSISIHMLATHTDYRKQGFATSLLQTCIQEAKTSGYKKTLLLTSPKIKYLYQSLGFKESKLYQIYASE
ncbi:MAG: GNAT family N-acetyltransferase [Candidatus Dependentiae bacterium]